MFAAVAREMDSRGRSDAAARLEGWLVEAGFGSVDPGERRLAYSGDDLVRQVPYVAAVVESTLPSLGGTPDARVLPLEAGLADLRALPATPGAALGWTVHKAHALH
jgi:hypothetical protein